MVRLDLLCIILHSALHLLERTTHNSCCFLSTRTVQVLGLAFKAHSDPYASLSEADPHTEQRSNHNKQHAQSTCLAVCLVTMQAAGFTALAHQVLNPNISLRCLLLTSRCCLQPLAVDWREKLKATRKGSKKGSSTSSSPEPAASAAQPQPAQSPSESAQAAELAMTADGKPNLELLSQGLPAGWRAMWDKNTGDIYYGNLKSRVRFCLTNSDQGSYSHAPVRGVAVVGGMAQSCCILVLTPHLRLYSHIFLCLIMLPVLDVCSETKSTICPDQPRDDAYGTP